MVKKSYIMRNIVLLLTVTIASGLNAAVLVVDNTPGAGAPYTTLQPAINAASADDTIMVQSSALSYGSVTIGKKLVLIGPGHHPETAKNATIGIITMNNGSSGTTITGMEVQAVHGAVNQVAHDLRILRNYFFYQSPIRANTGGGSSSNGWLIEGNVFVENTDCGGCLMINLDKQTSNNWVFRNNIFITRATATSNTRLFSDLNATTVLYHNIIIHRNLGHIFGGPIGSWGDESFNALLQNNIIWVTNASVTDIDVNCTNCQWVHNLTYHSSATLDVLPGTTNLDNTDPQFVNVTISNYGYDHDYHCSPGSPGETGASDGGMLGIFGGGYPFSMNGYPEDIPIMLEMILDNVIIKQGNNSTVRVRAVGGAD